LQRQLGGDPIRAAGVARAGSVQGDRPAKVRRRSPEILSGSEVSRLLDATTSLKYRAIFMLAYRAGLRISEVVSLEATDIDSERMLLHVRESKTGPRYVMMSPRVLEALRAYWRAFRPSGPRQVPSPLDLIGTERGRMLG
jgi:integrase